MGVVLEGDPEGAQLEDGVPRGGLLEARGLAELVIAVQQLLVDVSHLSKRLSSSATKIMPQLPGWIFARSRMPFAYLSRTAGLAASCMIMAARKTLQDASQAS